LPREPDRRLSRGFVIDDDLGFVRFAKALFGSSSGSFCQNALRRFRWFAAHRFS
jgi:hypothetical protein